ncbi:MAG: hypothetical protein M1833_004814 [Piccolia ochrophora]|nr:MAG: hypothetical protein M1833_004814 [Piccolia ochrophora]
MSTPPDSPPRHAGFAYLPAPVPRDEMQRLRIYEQLDVAWPAWAVKKTRQILELAIRLFGTPNASLSFFDDEREILKAENGYKRGAIPRSMSVGAHVLLSTEAMVISDARKDWRFQGNPLVTDLNLIRFYAGAPIVAADGTIVGVMAVFDSRPRHDFPINLRRKLVDLTKITMIDLELVVEAYQASDSQDAPPPEADYLPKDFQIPRKAVMLSDNPCAVTARTKRTSQMLYRSLTEESNMIGGVSLSSRNIAVQNPNSETVDHDLSSVDKDSSQPPRTNVPTSKIARSLSVDPRVRNSALPTPPYTPYTPYVTGRPFSISSVGSVEKCGVPPGSPDPAKLQSASGMPALQEVLHPDPRIAQLSFAVCLMARNLGYDFLYILRINALPENVSSVSDKEIEHTSLQLLACHGLPNPAPPFDRPFHLRALRDASGLKWCHDFAFEQEDGECDYKLGIVIPLARDAENRGSGFVLGAFTKHCDRNITAEEIAKLKESALKLHTVLREISLREKVCLAGFLSDT